MLLITVNEWFGPTAEGEGKVPVSEYQTALVSYLPLPEALLHLKAYELAHNSKYRASAINFTLLAVSTIDNLDSDVRKMVDIQMIEDLPTTAEEID